MARKTPSIRPDLWNAILDYRSQKRFVWDGANAVVVDPGTPVDESLVLPTITADDFIAWKREFANSKKVDGNEDLNLRLESWASKNLPTSVLPVKLQGPWNGELKTRVNERLNEFFARNRPVATENQPQAVVAVPVVTPTPPALPDQPRDALREAIVAAVREMTYRELLEIRLPSIALVRGKR